MELVCERLINLQSSPLLSKMMCYTGPSWLDWKLYSPARTSFLKCNDHRSSLASSVEGEGEESSFASQLSYVDWHLRPPMITIFHSWQSENTHENSQSCGPRLLANPRPVKNPSLLFQTCSTDSLPLNSSLKQHKSSVWRYMAGGGLAEIEVEGDWRRENQARARKRQQNENR